MVENPTGGKETWKMNIDMTKKAWETHFHTFSDVLITPSTVRASDQVPHMKVWMIKHSLFLSREDLSFSVEDLMIDTSPLEVPFEPYSYHGTCKIVKAPKRAS